MILKNIEAVEQALMPYYKAVAETTGKCITVDRMLRLMAHIGNPEADLKVVHVAGTSGKTSTTQYVATLLHASGSRVGHTVSPHVLSLTERVQIDGVPLGEKQFCELMGLFLDVVADIPEDPSWFELMTAFALWVFAREKVDYAVIETGMGGLHDASNVCNRPDKVCVLTDIGLDHTQFLGDSLPQIAGQKAGIVYPGNSVIMYEQAPEIMQVVKFKLSQTEDAELYIQHQDMLQAVYKSNKDDFVPDFPQYQQRNWLLAYAVYRFIARRDKLALIDVVMLRRTQQLVLGRMQIIKLDKRTIILDAAHNPPKMQAFIDSFQLLYPCVHVPVLMALKEHKKTEDISPILRQIASSVVVTQFSVNQDFWQTTSQDPSEVAKTFRNLGVEVQTVKSVELALQTLLAKDSDIFVVTGSIYLLGVVMKLLSNEKWKPYKKGQTS